MSDDREKLSQSDELETDESDVEAHQLGDENNVLGDEDRNVLSDEERNVLSDDG